MNVTPVPKLPFFTFVVASVLSLVLGHIATEFNRPWGFGWPRGPNHRSNLPLLWRGPVFLSRFGVVRRCLDDSMLTKSFSRSQMTNVDHRALVQDLPLGGGGGVLANKEAFPVFDHGTTLIY